MPVAAVTSARQADRQLRVEDSPVGGQRTGVDGELHAALAGDDRDRRRLGPGTGRGRHEHQRQARALGDVDAPDAVEIVAGAEQIGRKLGDIHRAPAAEADDRSHACFAPGRDRGFQGGPRGIGFDRVEQDDGASALLERPARRLRQAKLRPIAGRYTNRQGPAGNKSAIVSDFPAPAIRRGPG